MSLYHLKEKASGSKFFIPSEKTRNSSALKESGKITNNGAIRKKKYEGAYGNVKIMPNSISSFSIFW